MVEKDKELLFRDLCARLPYKVKVHAKVIDIDTNTEVEKVGILSMIDNDTVVAFTCDDTNCYNYVAIHEVKPYLFPLSSMTEEEIKEYKHLVAFSGSPNGATNFTDWLNAHHFDYRGLIPMELAKDATGLNIY